MTPEAPFWSKQNRIVANSLPNPTHSQSWQVSGAMFLSCTWGTGVCPGPCPLTRTRDLQGAGALLALPLRPVCLVQEDFSHSLGRGRALP